jgi:hypothetical protein
LVLISTGAEGACANFMQNPLDTIPTGRYYTD